MTALSYEPLLPVGKYPKVSFPCDAEDDVKQTKQEPCDDAISRQEAIEAFQMFREYESNRSHKEWVELIETVLNQLPSVRPQESRSIITGFSSVSWFY